MAEDQASEAVAPGGAKSAGGQKNLPLRLIGVSMCQFFDLPGVKLGMVGLLLTILLAGCVAGVSTPRGNLEMSIGSPVAPERRELPVIYPYLYPGRSPETGIRTGGEPLAEAFGPVWHGLQAEYPEYRFN
jgi:hypothetical protein